MEIFRLQNEADGSFQLLLGEKKLSVHSGDLMSLTADALVCPVDANLNCESGLAKEVMSQAGRQSQVQKPILPEPYGKVIVMPGGKLKTKYLFLTVLLGERGLDKMKLSISQAVDRAIRYAEFLRLKSIAFPVLGSPQEAPPYDFVAHQMMENITQYFNRRNTKIKAILFSAYNPQAFSALQKEAKNLTEL